MSIFSKVFSNIHNCRDKVALRCLDRSISYSQLDNAIKSLAKSLNTSGIMYNERVLILLPNCPEFVATFFAVTYMGGIAILADIKLAGELYGICEENNVRFIITDKNGEVKINNIWSRVIESEYSGIKRKIQILSVEKLGIFNNEAIAERCKKEYPQEAVVRQEDTAMILYTSGSTGKPKGVINTHGTLVAALQNYLETLNISASDRLVAVAPFFHSYSFGSCMLAGLAAKSTLFIQQSFQPRLVMKLIKDEKITLFHGVPYMYSLMLQHFNNNEYSFRSLRYCISAGAPLTNEIAEGFYELTGSIIHQEYGSSETGTIAINLSDDLRKNVISVGCPLKNVQVRLLPMENLDCGIIQVKSPGRAIGYLGDRKFDAGWYSTGDLGKLDEDGFIYILGRVKRLINVAGLKVNPLEVEIHLLKHPEVAEVMVRGTAHPDFGEIVEAMVVRRSMNVTENDLIKFCSTHLALYKVPKIINWVETLTKSSTGKTIDI